MRGGFSGTAEYAPNRENRCAAIWHLTYCNGRIFGAKTSACLSAPEAGALPGCATLRWPKGPYSLRVLGSVWQAPKSKKPEQSKNITKAVPNISRTVFGVFARRSAAGKRKEFGMKWLRIWWGDLLDRLLLDDDAPPRQDA